MTHQRMRTLTLLLPAASLLVSTGIVAQQYARRQSLASELAETERRIEQIRRQKAGAGQPIHPTHGHECCH